MRDVSPLLQTAPSPLDDSLCRPSGGAEGAYWGPVDWATFSLPYHPYREMSARAGLVRWLLVGHEALLEKMTKRLPLITHNVYIHFIFLGHILEYVDFQLNYFWKHAYELVLFLDVNCYLHAICIHFWRTLENCWIFFDLHSNFVVDIFGNISILIHISFDNLWLMYLIKSIH